MRLSHLVLLVPALLLPKDISAQVSPGQQPIQIPDTLHVITIPAKRGTFPDTAYIRAVQRGDPSWFTGQNAAYARAVEIMGVDSAHTCESREVEFTYLSNASPTGAPPSVRARGQWVPERSSVRRDSAMWQLDKLLEDDDLKRLTNHPGAHCVAVAHWRLGDSPGRQYLRARLIRAENARVSPDVAAQTTDLFVAVAHAPPAIIAGLVLPFKGESSNGSGEESEDDEESSRTVETIVGFDFPLINGALSPDAQDKLSHIRPMVATNLSDPGEDIYIGVEFFPLFRRGGARSAANPLQLTFGWKFDNGDDDSFFAGLHFSTTGLLNDLLKAVGGG